MMIKFIQSYTVRAKVDLYTPHAQRGLTIWLDCVQAIYHQQCGRDRQAVEQVLNAHSTANEREQFGLYVEEL